MARARMRVWLFAVAVLVCGAWGTLAFCTEEGPAQPTKPAAAPEVRKLTGIVVAKGETWIEVKADGEAEARRYVPVWRGGLPADGGGFDKEMLATIRKLIPGSRVEMQWKGEERLRVVALTVLVPGETSGTASGVITAKGDRWIEVKPEDGQAQRYFARWMGGLPQQGGGPDEAMLRLFAELKIGEKVKVQWQYDERLRAVRVERIGN